MSVVYILSTYGEYGAENVRATLDSSNLERMAQEYPKRDTTHEVGEIRKLLSGPVTELLTKQSGHDLSNGWGGMMLHVVEIEP